MSTVNMKVVQQLVGAADKAFDAWKTAGSYALTQHSGYVAALKTNAASRAASEELRGYCNTLLTQLHSDPSTDAGWFPKIGAIRDKAIYQVQTLDAAKALVIADMTKYLQLAFPPGEAAKFGTALDAAAAVDAKAKSQDPYQNRKSPEKQDTSQPPVDAPPETAESRWPLFAGLAAGGALLLKLLKVW